jgi:hypothetical protein
MRGGGACIFWSKVTCAPTGVDGYVAVYVDKLLEKRNESVV